MTSLTYEENFCIFVQHYVDRGCSVKEAVQLFCTCSNQALGRYISIIQQEEQIKRKQDQELTGNKDLLDSEINIFQVVPNQVLPMRQHPKKFGQT